jgi:hypothetical protein
VLAIPKAIRAATGQTPDLETTMQEIVSASRADQRVLRDNVSTMPFSLSYTKLISGRSPGIVVRSQRHLTAVVQWSSSGKDVVEKF